MPVPVHLTTDENLPQINTDKMDKLMKWIQSEWEDTYKRKAASMLVNDHTGQALNYMRATRLELKPLLPNLSWKPATS